MQAPTPLPTPLPTPTIDPARPFGIDDPTVAQVTERLRDPDPRIRIHAVRFLTARRAEAQPAVPALAAALTDPVSQVAIEAAVLLEHLGPAASAAVPALVGMLEGELDQCSLAAGTLAGIGIPAQAVPSLVACSRKGRPHEHGRLRTFEALTKLRPAPPLVLERLAEGVAESNPRIRTLAAAALRDITPSERATVIDSLAQGLASSSTAVQRDVIRAIADAGPEGAAAVPALYGALRSDSAQVREAARLAILAVRAP